MLMLQIAHIEAARVSLRVRRGASRTFRVVIAHTPSTSRSYRGYFEIDVADDVNYTRHVQMRQSLHTLKSYAWIAEIRVIGGLRVLMRPSIPDARRAKQEKRTSAQNGDVRH